MITPDDLQGEWRRDWLKAPGLEDHETAVHWMQAGRLYADIRIPADRPDIGGARALAELPDAVLRDLMRAEGFAGVITVENDICTWAREINWHGRPVAVDAGHIAFDGGPDRLIETGAGADYAERWHRADTGPGHALRLRADRAVAYLVTVGARFIFGVGDTGAASSDAVIRALGHGRRDADLRRLFGHIFVLGHWDRGRGIADLATNPYIEGQAILTCRAAMDITWHATGFDGAKRDIALVPSPVQSAA